MKQKTTNVVVPHPDLPPILYRIGMTVILADTRWGGEQAPCKMCKGRGQLTLPIPDTNELTNAECPKCYGKGYKNGNWRFHPHVCTLTVGSIQVNTWSNRDGRDDRIRYMAIESGIGSGSVFSQRDLYPSQHEAERAAEEKTTAAMKEFKRIHRLDSDSECWVKKG